MIGGEIRLGDGETPKKISTTRPQANEHRYSLSPDTKQLGQLGKLMTDTQTEASSTEPANRRSSSDFLRQADTWWSVLILLFCFTAGCGIPILWVSKAFNVPGKIVVTLLVTLYTIAIFWVFFVIMAWAWQQISQSL